MTDTVLYYEDFTEIKKKIWSMLTNAVKDRGSPFRIPVFICGDQSDFDGRIVVLRKADETNNLVQYHSDIRSDKIAKLSANQNYQAQVLILTLVCHFLFLVHYQLNNIS